MSTISQQMPPLFPARPRSVDGSSGRAASEVGAVAATSPIPDAETAIGGLGGGAVGSDPAALRPESLKDRIDDLLAQQVAGGSLTRPQAETLKGAFGASDDGTQSDGTGQRAAGPSPGPSPRDRADDTASDTDGAATSPSSTASASDLLASFVKQLQSTQDRTSAYRSDGARASGQTASALLLNFKA